MSLECGECERDLRGGHDPECSRHPDNRTQVLSKEELPDAFLTNLDFEVNNLERITEEIFRWANGIMPNRVPADAIKKLSMEEVPELWRALKENGCVDEGEIADVLILALDICAMSLIDPVKAIRDKMEVNRQREWKFEHGVLQHVEN